MFGGALFIHSSEHSSYNSRSALRTFGGAFLSVQRTTICTFVGAPFVRLAEHSSSGRRSVLRMFKGLVSFMNWKIALFTQARRHLRYCNKSRTRTNICFESNCEVTSWIILSCNFQPEVKKTGTHSMLPRKCSEKHGFF